MTIQDVLKREAELPKRAKVIQKILDKYMNDLYQSIYKKLREGQND